MSDQSEDQTEAELERTRQAIADTAALATEDLEDDDISTVEDDEEIDTGWAAYTKDELVEECRNRGLAVSGNKDELVERLDDDDRESGA